MKRALVALMLCASCARPAPTIVRTTSSPPPTAGPTPSATAAPTVLPNQTQTQTPAPAAPRPAAPTVPGAGDATQAIVVRSSSWNSTVATLEAYSKDRGAWHVFVPPTSAFVGVNGFAQNKHEGDGRTPAGVYGFSLIFGTQPSPGVQFAYRQATSPDVWVDDPASSLYNTWQREPSNGRWKSAERLYQPGPYAYAAAIAYNTSRVAGKGSAIFLHVTLGHATSGCVSVERSVLVRLLRWLDPHRAPVIVMGPSSYVDHL